MTSVRERAALSAGDLVAARKSAARGNERAVAAWLFTCCALIFLVVIVGGITRLTQSGLSITDWDPIIGVLPPLSYAAWQTAFAQYKSIAQYRLIHFGMTLGAFKTIFLWEYAHRLLARLAGLLYGLPFLYFLWRGRLPWRLVPPLAGILGLGFCQGLLGWYMVESGLAGRADVSQYRLAAHLALALLIYAAILWVALGLVRAPAEGFDPGPSWRRAAEGVVALVALTITAGAFVAGLHAGLVYNSFPLMDGRLVPQSYATLHPFARNWFENVAAVQFDHRLLATAAVAAILLLWTRGLRAALPRPARNALHLLLVAVLVQAGLGISTLLLVVPVPLAVAHQAGAVVLLTAAILSRHALSRPA
ncbi:MAG TPA: COX15/CtaA family protein [Stellaceae bacterium]|nr:COX15/CtaA family protein [Stellaceae bacterium]